MMLEQGKIMKLRGVILLVSIIAVICMGHEATAAPGPAIVYTMKTVERLDPRCSRGASDCPVYIRFSYPVIVRGPSPAATRAITRAINDFLLTGVGEPRKFSSIAAAMDEFMRRYEEYRKLTLG